MSVAKVKCANPSCGTILEKGWDVCPVCLTPVGGSVPESEVVAPPKSLGSPEEIANSIGMKLRLIPAGNFMMGSDEWYFEQPVHEVEFTKPFYMGVYPVTQGEWKKVMGSNPSHFRGDDRPVEKVNWYDTQEFIQRLNEKEKTSKYRLPTEAEWEYACRAGSGWRYCFGDDEDGLGDYAWYGNSEGETQPVGRKRANDWGLYDMHGNVWEWCQDWYDADFYKTSSKKDPCGPSSGRVGVLRGGSFGDVADECRSAFRNAFDRTYRFNFGFRVVQDC